jgi:transmembrane sensor
LEEKLIIKFLKGECSPQEEQRIIHWLEDPAARVQVEKLLEKHWENPTLPIADTTDYTSLLDRIHHRVVPATTSRKVSIQAIAFRSIRIAASLFLIIFTGYFLSLSWVSSNKTPELVVTNPVKIIERTTSIGEKLTLTMPDGTRIIVNSESKVQFNSDYGRTDRIVILNGEAYFEVAPDTIKPFKVNTNGFTTYALGTAFNISAKQSTYKVALTEGKVRVGAGVEEVNLVPGQMAAWQADAKEKSFKVQRFDVEKETAWKDGRLAFDKRPLGQILKDLETWYSVTIQTDPSIDLRQRISGTFENKNLKDILTGLSFTTAFSFELNGKQVTINKRL